jgi:hypothetical protein
MQDISAEDRRLYASVDTDFIGQNVYLFCAASPTPKVARAARQVKDLARAVRRKAGRVGRGPAKTAWRPAANNAERDRPDHQSRGMGGWTGGCQAHYHAIPPPESAIANSG